MWHVGLLFLLVSLLSWGSARAHPQFALSTVNRYGRLVLLPNRVRLDYSLMVGEVPAEQLKRQADVDGNGTLSEQEQSQLCEHLQHSIEREVRLQVDQKPLPLRWTVQPLALKVPTVEPAPFALELSGEVALPDDHRPHELRFDDRADLPPVGEVELRIEDSPFVELLTTRSGSAQPSSESVSTTSSQVSKNPLPESAHRVPTLFRQFGPPRSLLSDRSVSLRVQRRLPPTPPSRFPWSYLAALSALLAMIGFAFATRRLLRH
jgi:hypothetical protein